MTTQQIQSLRDSHPFEPFRLLVADGRTYDVRHPENFMITGNGRILAVAMPDHVVVLDLLLVNGVQSPIPGKRSGTRRKGA